MSDDEAHTVTEHWDAHGGEIRFRTCSCGEEWTRDEEVCPEAPDPATSIEGRVVIPLENSIVNFHSFGKWPEGGVVTDLLGALQASIEAAQAGAPTRKPQTPSHAYDLEVFVPGRPAPQGSKRHVGGGRMIEQSKYVGTWRDDVRAACLAVWVGRPPMDGPLTLEVEFIRKRPASAPKSRTPAATTAPDLSKLVRSTEDAITSAGVWADDARVVRCVSSKRVAEIGEAPGAWIRIAPAEAAS